MIRLSECRAAFVPYIVTVRVRHTMQVQGMEIIIIVSATEHVLTVASVRTNVGHQVDRHHHRVQLAPNTPRRQQAVPQLLSARAIVDTQAPREVHVQRVRLESINQ